jgi:hypothetical protein
LLRPVAEVPEAEVVNWLVPEGWPSSRVALSPVINGVEYSRILLLCWSETQRLCAESNVAEAGWLSRFTAVRVPMYFWTSAPVKMLVVFTVAWETRPLASGTKMPVV